MILWMKRKLNEIRTSRRNKMSFEKRQTNSLLVVLIEEFARIIGLPTFASLKLQLIQTKWNN